MKFSIQGMKALLFSSKLNVQETSESSIDSSDY